MPRIRHRLDRTLDHLRRYQHILRVLTRYGFQEVGDALRARLGSRAREVGHVSPEARLRSRPERMRMALEELGPTFIKFGQLLSTRPDLLPPEYIAELEHLQDRIAPVPFDQIRRVVERELDAPLADHFQSFETECLAAGSIAQVHRATTLDGHQVAVKVCRPGVKESLKTECEILEDVAAIIKATLAEDETVDPVRLVQEFTEAVRYEADLAHERENMERFEQNFHDDPTVHIPRALPQWSSSCVLTMEYIDGVKPGTRSAIAAAGLDPKKVADHGANFVLRQVFEFGLFHTDPHPGNLLIAPGNVVVPLDFGQVANLQQTERRLLGELVLGIVDQDASSLVDAFEKEGMLDPRTDVNRLTRDVEQMLRVYHQMPLKDIPFAQMMGRTFEVIRQHRVHPPAEFTLMLKSMMTIESVAVTLNPDFRLIEALRPYARKMATEELDPGRLLRRARRVVRDTAQLAGRLPGDVNVILSKLLRGQFQVHIQHEHLEDLGRTFERSSNRVSFAMIIAGLLIGSSMLVTQHGYVLGIIDTQTMGVLGYIVAAVLGLGLLVSIMRGGKL